MTSSTLHLVALLVCRLYLLFSCHFDPWSTLFNKRVTHILCSRCWHQDWPYTVQSGSYGGAGPRCCGGSSRDLHRARDLLLSSKKAARCAHWGRQEGSQGEAFIISESTINYFSILKRALFRMWRTLISYIGLQVQKLSKNEVLMVNIGSLSTGGRVSAVKADLAKIVLTNPVCTEVGEKIALSRRVEKHWRWASLIWVLDHLDFQRSYC